MTNITKLSTMELVEQRICVLCEEAKATHNDDMCQGCIDFFNNQDEVFDAEMEQDCPESTNCQVCNKGLVTTHERSYSLCGRCEDKVIADYESRRNSFE